MWASYLQTLAPLTRIKSHKRNFKWTKREQDDFNDIKRVVARETLLTYSGLMEHLKFTLILATSN